MLTLISGLGPVGQNLLLSVCGNIDICFELAQAEILAKNEKSIRCSVSDHNSGMDRSQRSTVAHRQLLAFLEQREKPELRSRAEEILNTIDKYGISLIIKENEAYPKRFAGIADIPVLRTHHDAVIEPVAQQHANLAHLGFHRVAPKAQRIGEMGYVKLLFHAI